MPASLCLLFNIMMFLLSQISYSELIIPAVTLQISSGRSHTWWFPLAAPGNAVRNREVQLTHLSYTGLRKLTVYLCTLYNASGTCVFFKLARKINIICNSDFHVHSSNLYRWEYTEPELWKLRTDSRMLTTGIELQKPSEMQKIAMNFLIVKLLSTAVSKKERKKMTRSEGSSTFDKT